MIRINHINIQLKTAFLGCFFILGLASYFENNSILSNFENKNSFNENKTYFSGFGCSNAHECTTNDDS